MNVLILNRRGFHVSTAKTTDNINSSELKVTEVYPTTYVDLQLGDQYQIGYINGNNMVHRTLTRMDSERASAIFRVNT